MLTRRLVVVAVAVAAMLAPSTVSARVQGDGADAPRTFLDPDTVPE